MGDPDLHPLCDPAGRPVHRGGRITGMGIAKVAVSLSMFRKLVYFLSMLFLPMVFGVEKVFFAEPISDIIACMTSTATYLLLSGKVLGDHKRF